jgi:hypothetical protein
MGGEAGKAYLRVCTGIDRAVHLLCSSTSPSVVILITPYTLYNFAETNDTLAPRRPGLPALRLHAVYSGKISFE